MAEIRNITKVMIPVTGKSGEVYHVLPRSLTDIPGGVKGSLPEGLVLSNPKPENTEGDTKTSKKE